MTAAKASNETDRAVRRIAVAPVHGEVKMRGEGLRTRDGHVLEWISRLQPELELSVYSRAEPFPRLTLSKRRSLELPDTWRFSSPEPLVIPLAKDRRKWWTTSLEHRKVWSEADAALIWNPIEGAEACRNREVPRIVVFELLDDWLNHQAFSSIKTEIEQAYETVFSVADHVTANSEATVALARRFGRDDVEFLPNGVDPERFAGERVSSEELTIGYGGKIDFRLDVDLVESAARALPKANFSFVGPIFDRSVGKRLRAISNVTLVGDVRYNEYPDQLRRWDVAWVPHLIGDNEVGGDLIKLYEYRAAALPTFSTKVIGWQRALPGVRACDRDAFVEELVDFVGSTASGPVPREPIELPAPVSWRWKTERLLSHLGVLAGDTPV